MTDATNVQALKLPASEACHKWGWFVALGAGLLIVGGLAFVNLMLATVASVLFTGAMMLVGGVVQVIHAFQVKTWSRFFFWLISGLIYAGAGIVCAINPLLASAVLTLMLAVILVIAGAMRIWVGVEAHPDPGRGWVIATGVITLLLGVIIAIGWPVNSLFILGMFLAIDLVFQGWAFIALGFALKSKLTA